MSDYHAVVLVFRTSSPLRVLSAIEPLRHMAPPSLEFVGEPVPVEPDESQSFEHLDVWEEYSVDEQYRGSGGE